MPRKARAPEGRYVNYFEVGHNAAEFVIDFGQFHVEQDMARLHTRIVTSPVYAKLLAAMLTNAVERYEGDHGNIEADDNDDLDPLEVVRQSIDGYDHALRFLAHKRANKG